MEATSQRVLELALGLPETERVRIVQCLLESLGPDTEEPQDDAWEAELDRRMEEFEQGQAGAMPWSEVKRQQH